MEVGERKERHSRRHKVVEKIQRESREKKET